MADQKQSADPQALGINLKPKTDRIVLLKMDQPDITKNQTITTEELFKGSQIISPYMSDASVVSVTGTVAETVLAILPIPVNTISARDILRIKAFNQKLGANARGDHRLRVNTAPDLSGAPVQLALWNNAAATSNHNIKMLREFFVLSLSQTLPAQLATTNIATDDAVTATPSLINIDWTVQQYLLITSQLGSALDTAVLNGFYMEILRKA